VPLALCSNPPTAASDTFRNVLIQNPKRIGYYRMLAMVSQKSITILIMQGVSLTSKAEEEIEKSKSIIDYFFTVEDIIGDEDIRKDLFKILKI